MEPKPLPVGADAPSDEALLSRVLAGDLASFELLMRRHNQRVFRVCRSVLKSDEEAEDAAQQAWVDAYSHLSGFEARSSLSTWLCRIALHVSLARLRKRGREVHLVDEETIVEHSNPEDLAAGSEMRRLIERAVSALPPALASAFVLREVEGLSTAEAATCLEISEDAVKTRLLRAKRLLRDEVERELGRSAPELFRFDGARCDRMVRNVLDRIRGAG